MIHDKFRFALAHGLAHGQSVRLQKAKYGPLFTACKTVYTDSIPVGAFPQWGVSGFSPTFEGSPVSPVEAG